MVPGERLRAWRPEVAGVREVLHARFTEHAYPMHSHDAWTLLVVDAGAVRYELERSEHGALTSLVTLLPPDVPHDGRSARPGGFRKRVIYLEREVLGEEFIGPAVDRPELVDPVLRRRVHQLLTALALSGEELEAASRLALVGERLRAHLRRADVPRLPPADPPLAARLRELLDARVAEGLSLETASTELTASAAHLVRAFSREYGMPPHRYLTARRVDLARRHLLAGRAPAEAAVSAGFYDQSHLDRHFRRVLGVTSARFRGA